MADVFSSIACGCSVSTVKIRVPLANLYRLQPVATDSKKTRYSVSTVLVNSVHQPGMCQTAAVVLFTLNIL